MKNEPTNSHQSEAPQAGGIRVVDLVFEWANTLFIFLTVVLLVMTFFFRQVTVNGPSMNDTLSSGDRLVVSGFLYDPQPGDIVVVTHGAEHDEPIIKRVIAVEGQSLWIDYTTGEVYVNGALLDEPYIKGTTVMEQFPLEIPEVIPEGYVFVMGDNRENSLDSRSTKIGMIPKQNIIGKAIFRFFPFNTFGGLYP